MVERTKRTIKESIIQRDINVSSLGSVIKADKIHDKKAYAKIYALAIRIILTNRYADWLKVLHTIMQIMSVLIGTSHT